MRGTCYEYFTLQCVLFFDFLYYAYITVLHRKGVVVVLFCRVTYNVRSAHHLYIYMSFTIEIL